MFKKLFGFCSVWFVCSFAIAQESEQVDGADDSVAKNTLPGGILTTNPEQRGEILANQQQITWFESGGERMWMASQASRSEVLGQALVVGIGAPNQGVVAGFSGLKDLLPSFGWHAHYFDYSVLLSLSAEIQEGWLKNAFAAIPEAPRFLLVAQGQACLNVVAQLSEIQPFALVCVDTPVNGQPLQVSQQLQPLVDVTVPTLVLQHAPRRWPPHQAVGQDVELHLLPRLNGQERLLKRIRGWLKRRHKV